MRTFRRVALSVLVAALMAGLGAVGGFVVHWYVLQPSDDELREHVAEVTPDGLTIVSVPTVTGRSAPLLERGDLHWEVAVAEGLPVEVVSSHVEGAGWDVEVVRRQGSATYLGATKGPMHLRVWFASPGEDDSATIGFTLRRRAYPISLGMSVALGAGLGALMGGALGWFGPRLRPGKES